MKNKKVLLIACLTDVSSVKGQQVNSALVWFIKLLLFCEKISGLIFFFSILIVSTSLFAIIYRDTVNPGLVGLSLTYALTCQLDIFLLTR